MKRLYIYIIFLAGMSCKKDFLNVNTNPNDPSFTTIGLALPNALNVTGSGQVMNYTFISGWMQQWAISAGFAPSSNDFTTYKQTTDFGNGLWLSIYDNLQDYDYVETNAIAQNKPFYEAAAKIMKAYNFQQLVDMFGDIPYTGAFQGTRNVRPVYDNAQLIYDSLVVNIDSAITLMRNPEAAADENGDILFKGSKTDWIRFANTLKLRILMRQSVMPGRASYIQQEIEKSKLNGGGFLIQDANVNPGYSNDDSKQNNFYSSFYNVRGTYINSFWVANQYAIDFYKHDTDARRSFVYSRPVSDTLFRGNYIGLSRYPKDSCSRFGPGVLKSSEQPATIMLVAESYFLQAEAAERGLTGGDAKQLYESGVTQSFVFLRAVIPPVKSQMNPDQDSIIYSPQESAAVYLTLQGSPGNWEEAADKIKLIITQKWAAENSVTPFEEWCDYRRTGFPQVPLTRSPFADIKAIPVRILYPSSEYQTNASNVPAQTADAHHTQKLFWMP